MIYLAEHIIFQKQETVSVLPGYEVSKILHLPFLFLVNCPQKEELPHFA